MHKELDILTPCYAACKLSFDFDCSHDTKWIKSDNLTPVYDVSDNSILSQIVCFA